MSIERVPSLPDVLMKPLEVRFDMADRVSEPMLPVVAKRLVEEAVVAKKLVVVALPLTNRLPFTLNFSFGVVEPIPRNPLLLMVRAV